MGIVVHPTNLEPEDATFYRRDSRIMTANVLPVFYFRPRSYVSGGLSSEGLIVIIKKIYIYIYYKGDGKSYPLPTRF